MSLVAARDALRRALGQAHPVIFTLVAGLAGFSAYFAMYAFRKPFTAATFEAVPGWTFALDYKIALVLAQVAGYALSKFVGVRFVSEIAPARRAHAILVLIGIAWSALLAFPLVPAPWNVALLFLNGLPLGMIWGLVYGAMEGRRTSETLAALLCASFILSSGAVKSVGAWLMRDLAVDRFWMPAAIGALFVPLLLASVFVLDALPPPDAADKAARVRRAPMDAAERRAFLLAWWPGLLAIVVGYVLLTALRDYRDNFAAEIWQAVGLGRQAAIFSASELPVAAISLLVMATVNTVRDNRKALLVIQAMVGGGCALIALATLAFRLHLLGPVAWMILIGSGLYMAYNPINAILFDRLVACSGRKGTAGFMIYVADSAGYLGSVVVLLWRDFVQTSFDWLGFLVVGAYATGVIGCACALWAALWFVRHLPHDRTVAGLIEIPA